MKKIFLFLSAALLLTAACNKSETVVRELGSNELGFRALSGNTTKAGELDGVILPNSYGIYAAASQKNASGLIENASFFSGNEHLFATADDPATAASLWKGDPAVFWPIGGVRMDFLAYAIQKANHAGALATGVWRADWDYATTDVARQVSFKDVDTYANQNDVLFAVANDQTSAANGGSGKSVALEFNHAQALLIFNVKANNADKVTINEISFVTPERVAALRAYQNALAAYDPSAHDAWQAVKDAHDAWVSKKAAHDAWQAVKDAHDAWVSKKAAHDAWQDVKDAHDAWQAVKDAHDAWVSKKAAHDAWQDVKDTHDAWVAKKAADGYDDMDDAGKAAWDAANPEPAAPGDEPAAPGAEPEAPGVEPEAPGVEPEAPGVEPEAPGVEPEAPGEEPAVPGPEPSGAPVLADLADADVTLKTVGTFTVNNERNILAADWTFGSGATKAENYKMKSGSTLSPANVDLIASCIDYGTAVGTENTQLGETLLIPEQEKVNFTIKYTAGGNTMYYTVNDFRGVWQKGHKYVYNIDLLVNEIVITEQVADFTMSQSPVAL